MQLSSNKIEHKALNGLETIIDNHPTMDYDFNSTDKEMSWDGFIYLYEDGSKNASKTGFSSRVPVQIKGHMDLQRKKLGKKKVSVPVEIDDLKAYATEKGVIYFQVFMHDEIQEVYYCSLYPSRIAVFIEKAEKRGNKHSLSIPFIRLENDPQKLFDVVKQFDIESKKQGTAFTPLVQNRIRLDDLNKLTEINLTIHGAETPFSALHRLASGDICLYGKTEKDHYFRPIEWSDELVFFSGADVQNIISVNGDVYYTHYHCVVDSDDKIVIHPSPNLTLFLSEGRIEFRPVSLWAEVYKDAKFLLKVRDSKKYSIANHEIAIPDAYIAKEFEDKLEYLVDLYETLQMIGFNTETQIRDYSDEQKRQFREIVFLKRGYYNDRLPIGISKYIWKFGNKYVPLLVNKTDGTIILADAIYGSTFEIYLPQNKNPESKGFRMPLFVYQDIDILANLYSYRFDEFKAQIDRCDINEMSANALIECVLIMIHVYDRNGDQRFLFLAEHLLDLLEGYTDIALIFLNRLQIKSRLGKLCNADIESLKSIRYDNDQLEFGRCVLLKDKIKATELYEQFSSHDKEKYQTFPIFKLYSEL